MDTQRRLLAADKGCRGGKCPEGYGDGTYRGDQEITRYEMAQMIARAMAKGGGDKALIDKLAAEFADELNNLGVRVAALEKKVDNVKWKGMVRYRYINYHREATNEQPKKNQNALLLRLEPQMTINKNWTANARIDYDGEKKDDDTGDHDYNTQEMDKASNLNRVVVDRVWVEGKYNNFLLKLGKFNVKTAADFGTTMDYRISGAEAVIGKDVQVAVRGGRLNLTDSTAFTHGPKKHYGYNDGKGHVVDGGETAAYIGVEVYNDRAKKFNWGLGWQHVRGQFDTSVANGYGNLNGIGENVNIFNLGLGYKFDKNVNLTGMWAFATGIDDKGAFDESKYKNTYAFQLNYKGAKQDKPRSWGAFVAWRHLGDVATIHPTAKENGPMYGGEKGWEIGVSYAFAKNIVGLAQYYQGKELMSEKKVNAVWTQLGFYF